MKNNPLSISVLYVEDDEIARENGIEYLENYFDTIYDASNALDALSLYNKYHFLRISLNSVI